MKTQILEQLLLLEASGELSPEQARELAAARASHPEAERLQRDLLVWQHAGQLISGTPVPALPETRREAILQAAETRHSGVRPWLAVAATLLLSLALCPMLTPREPLPAVADIDPPAVPMSMDALEEDPVLQGLEALDQSLRNLAAWNEADVLEPDADFWAEQLLVMEESR
jgi:hypothetical protein